MSPSDLSDLSSIISGGPDGTLLTLSNSGTEVVNTVIESEYGMNSTNAISVALEESKRTARKGEVLALSIADMVNQWLLTVTTKLDTGTLFANKKVLGTWDTLFILDLVFETCRGHVQEVEKLAARWTEQKSRGDPTSELLQDMLELFKKALPEAVRVGLSKTASSIRRKYYDYGRSELGKEEILKRLAAELIDTGEAESWAQAHGHKKRRAVLRDMLPEYEMRIVKAWEQDQQSGGA
ncbi:hypothetical protein HD553DRAFT_360985 [Filobasidium floriforme]|uniref:uncharacterized protein n=1 Tax=Filobasidium floriforme TaxID=5210 RepID=UPI001E8DA3F8|nr:uncharacterized protein HD553DRAFT_360985 [Filobasidium floriforme]KAH8080789.1 hypothetical protein HD553DRAFT_360985 [Filobasidium floriforme]